MQLIPISKQIIGIDAVNGCEGRKLHEFLEVQTVYTTWFYRRIEEYGFIEGQDFLSTLEESTGGRPEVNHFISIDMAKEMSMVEKTDKGKQARRYFIACEKELRNIAKGCFEFPRYPQLESLENRIAVLERANAKLETGHHSEISIPGYEEKREHLTKLIQDHVTAYNKTEYHDWHSDIQKTIIVYNGQIMFKGKVIEKLTGIARHDLNIILSDLGFVKPRKATSIFRKNFKVFKYRLTNQ